MSTTSWIARRYFRNKGKEPFLSFLSIIAIAGVTVGTFALMLILSVMNGFDRELTDRLLGFNAHLTIYAPTHAQKNVELAADSSPFTSVEALSKVIPKIKIRDLVPLIEGEVLLRHKFSKEEYVQGAKLRGVDSKKLGVLAELDYYIPEKKDGFKFFKTKSAIILGEELSRELFAYPDLAEKIEIIAPLAEVSPSGELVPQTKTAELVGMFRSGIYTYDSKYVLIDIKQAQELLGLQARRMWQIRLDDPQLAPFYIESLRKKLPKGWTAQSWHEQNQKLFKALKLERTVMSAVLALVILIASFSIIGVTLLSTAARRKDMAIFKSLGIRRGQLRMIFIKQGGYIGVLGSVLGVNLAWLSCMGLQKWPLPLPPAYYLDHLPVSLSLKVYFSVLCLGVIIAFAAAYFPVSRSIAEDPCEVLRYE